MVEITIKSNTFGYISGYAVNREKAVIYTNDCLIKKMIYPGDKVTLKIPEGNYELTIQSNDLFTKERETQKLPEKINFKDE